MAKGGTLFYLIGASGCGKDSLLDAVLATLRSRPDWSEHLPRRVQRYITRSADSGGEMHQAVSDALFTDYLQAERFCMHWEAHGYRYGIDREILDWLATGENVLMNGSRAYLSEARRVVPNLVALLIEVPDDIRLQRLQRRARESDAALQARMQRAVDIDSLDMAAGMLHRINNDGELSVAANAVCQLIVEHSL